MGQRTPAERRLESARAERGRARQLAGPSLSISIIDFLSINIVLNAHEESDLPEEAFNGHVNSSMSFARCLSFPVPVLPRAS